MPDNWTPVKKVKDIIDEVIQVFTKMHVWNSSGGKARKAPVRDLDSTG